MLATQNPIEFEGTCPLPEAQLDRFLMRISLGHPSPEEEIQIMDAQQHRHPIETLDQVVTMEELQEAQRAAREVYVDPVIKQYIVSIVSATRHHPDIYLGASPRGSLGLANTARALAALEGRDYVLPDDIKRLAVPVLAHRVIVSPAARIRDVDTRDVVQEVLSQTSVPGTRA